MIEKEAWIQGPLLPYFFQEIEDLSCVLATNSTSVLFLRETGLSQFNFKTNIWIHSTQNMDLSETRTCTLINEKNGQKFVYIVGMVYYRKFNQIF